MTDLVHGNPLWTAINAVPVQYPWLEKDETCEVAVVGAGLTGAMTAYQFAKAGIDTVLLAGSSIGYGSTSVSTGLLEYDAAGTLTELTEKIGSDEAVRVYEMAEAAVHKMERMVGELPDNAGFTRRDSLYYCDCPEHDDFIHEEYLKRRHTGFDVELIDRTAAKDRYSFPISSGIVSKNASAEVDPYRLTHALVAAAKEAGARIYEHSRIYNIATDDKRQTQDQVLSSVTRHYVYANKVVIASGYEAAQFTGGLTSQSTVFAMATKPVEGFAGWEDRSILRNHDCPELYLRTTADNRVIIGGLSSSFIDGGGRIGGILSMPYLASKRYCELETHLKDMFPGIRGLSAEYDYAGAFYTTVDGLPIIGGEAEHPGWYFALCPGDNGILWANIASDLLLELHKGEPSEDLAMFAPCRYKPASHAGSRKRKEAKR